ncbi:MAG: hypothetical protein FJ147_07175 [Deltaproteobacteria bacterium]|nr:hypothetical protein [Deltaproteobacteria bacterium]
MRKFSVVMVSLTTLALISSQLSYAQSSEEVKALREEIGALKEIQALRREVEGIREGQRALQKDLQEIKTLLQARPAGGAPPPPQNVVLSLDDTQTKGEKNAKLVLIEFTDYQ